MIDDVKIRTVFQYRVPKTSYIVELSLYRHCDGQTGEETTGNFGMSFFSDDWDFRMGHRHDVPYDWQPGADLKEFSLTTPKTNAFNEFLAKVKDVQALLGSVLSWVQIVREVEQLEIMNDFELCWVNSNFTYFVGTSGINLVYTEFLTFRLGARRRNWCWGLSAAILRQIVRSNPFSG